MADRVLLKFPHGLGDCAQFVMALRQILHAHPEWEIELRVSDRGKASLQFGRVRTIWEDSSAAAAYDQTIDVQWWDPDSVDSDELPATKSEQCLRREFRIEPDQSLCRYDPLVWSTSDADGYLNQMCRLLEHGRFNSVLIHYEGNTSFAQKNIPHDTVALLCDRVISLGFVPIILDWDRRSPIPNDSTIFCPAADNPLWQGLGTGHAATLAALIARSSLFVGIDSGPQKVAGWTDTPKLCVWTGQHPVNFFHPCDTALHLVPMNHLEHVRGDRDRAARLFATHYRSTVYTDLLTTLLRETQAVLCPSAETKTLIAYSFCSSHRKANSPNLTPGDHWSMLTRAMAAWNSQSLAELVVCVGPLTESPPAEVFQRAELIATDHNPGHQVGACEAIKQAANYARSHGYSRLIMLADDVLPTGITVDEIVIRLGSANYVGSHWGSHRALNTQVFGIRVDALFDAGNFRLLPHNSRVLEEQLFVALVGQPLDILPAAQRYYFHTHDPENFTAENANAQHQAVTTAEADLTTGRWLYTRVGHDSRPMRFERNGAISDGWGGQEQRWLVSAGPTLKICGDAGEVAWLTSDGSQWSGAWRFFEQMPITITRLDEVTITRNVSISVVIPTLGRPSLPAMLRSLAPQLNDCDEVVVVGDGPRPTAAAAVRSMRDPRIRYLEHHDDASIFGNAQRNVGVEHSTGDVLWFCDDDDQALPHALSVIRRELQDEVPVMFRMFHEGRVLWSRAVMEKANIGGAMFVVPRSRFLPWPVPGQESDSDFEWLVAIAADGLRWSDTPIYSYSHRGNGREG